MVCVCVCACARAQVFTMEGAIRSMPSGRTAPLRKRLDACRNQLQRQTQLFRRARLRGGASARMGASKAQAPGDLEMGVCVCVRVFLFLMFLLSLLMMGLRARWHKRR